MKSETEAQATPQPRELNRLEVLRGLRIATWEASFATVWLTLTSGLFLTGFALWLKADNFGMGLLVAVPTFAGLIQVVSSYLGERLRARKPFTAWFSLAGRGIWLIMPFLPILLPPSLALAAFLALFALSYVFLNIPVPAYMSWMSDLVPPDHRGRYFGRRNMIAGIVGMVLALPAAWFLDLTTKRNHWEQTGFTVLFSIGVLGGLFSFLCLWRQPEPPKHVAPPNPDAPKGAAGILAYYKTPFADRNFVRLLIFNLLFAVGQNIAAPFYVVYAVKNLKIDYVYLQIFATMTSIASLGSMPLWGYLADKFGSKPLLAIGVFGTATLPFFWCFTAPDRPGLTLFLVSAVHLMGGLSWAGVNLTQFNLLISLSPPQKTPIYVATMAAVAGLMGGLAPLLGSAIMRGLEGWTGHFFHFVWYNFQVTFLISAFLRFSSLLLLRPIKDPRAASAREVIQQLSRANPRAWLHIRKLQRSGVEDEKIRATEALGESRTVLAVNELQTALRDPSPAVRAEAARALGEIGESSAADALIEALRDPAAGLVTEAAQALGRIGDRRANPFLMNLLLDEEAGRRERLAAARALGELGGADAAMALRGVLQETQDEEMKETLVRALGEIGDTHALPLLLAEMEGEVPRPLRLALIRTLGELGEASAVETLRKALTHAYADPILLPTLADALARLGDTESIFPLVSALNRLDSLVARKQVAVAIGNLLGEGESVYSLLSQEDFARDAAVSKLLQDLQKRSREGEGSAWEALLERYVSGGYAECMEVFAPLAEEQFEASTDSSLPQRFLQVALHLSAPTVETVLLAFLAFRLCATPNR